MSGHLRALEKPWHCSVCTFENDSLMMACEVCSNPKEKGVEIPIAIPSIKRECSTDDKIIC